jgi:hypothetical protein
MDGGQTPKQLERRPFPAQNVAQAVKDNMIDFGTIVLLASVTPPLCVAEAPHRIKIRLTMTDTAKVGVIEQADKAVGDICFVKGQLRNWPVLHATRGREEVYPLWPSEQWLERSHSHDFHSISLS